MVEVSASGFGVVVSKAAKKHDNRAAQGGAAIGAGGIVGTVGLAGGGVPTVRSTRLLADVGSAPSRRGKAANATRAYRGGEFGYRTNAHKTYKTFNLGGKRAGQSQADHFSHGQKAGARHAEEKIIRHLKTGRKASNVALVGGAGLVAYGAHRLKKKNVSKAERKKTEAAFAGLAAGGATTAGAAYGGARTLEHQGRKWSKRAARDIDAAQKIVPRAGGHVVNPKLPGGKTMPNKRVPDIGPKVASSKIAKDPSILAGVTRGQAHVAGKLRGNATKSRYFAGTYGTAAHFARKGVKPALAASVVGGAGLAASRHQKKVKKNYFPVSKGASPKALASLRRVAQTNPGMAQRSFRAYDPQRRAYAAKRVKNAEWGATKGRAPSEKEQRTSGVGNTRWALHGAGGVTTRMPSNEHAAKAAELRGRRSRKLLRTTGKPLAEPVKKNWFKVE